MKGEAAQNPHSSSDPTPPAMNTLRRIHVCGSLKHIGMSLDENEVIRKSQYNLTFQGEKKKKEFPNSGLYYQITNFGTVLCLGAIASKLF